MRIAVLGAGAAGLGPAAQLAGQGHEVRLWPALAAPGAAGLSLEEPAGRRPVSLALAADDLRRVVGGARLVMAAVPLHAQADLARRLAPLLADGQVLFLPAGAFGSVVTAVVLRQAGCRARVALAESAGHPLLAARTGPAGVRIDARARRLPVGCFPARDAGAALAALGEAFPGAEPVEDALAAALLNPGPILHPPRLLMDVAGAGSPRGEAAIRRVVEALDAERIALRAALGYGGEHFPVGEGALLAGGEPVETTDDLAAHPHLRDDAAQGLAFLASAAGWAGVRGRLAAGLLAIGSAVCGEDLRRGPRTLETLGLAGLDRVGMRRLLDRGLR